MVRAAQVGAAAQAVRLEQKFEDETLTTGVKKLAAHRGNKAKQAEDLRELRELVRRDKREVEILSNVLGSSSGVSTNNYVTGCWTYFIQPRSTGSNLSDMPEV
jgi:hypothetical protein